MHLDKKQRPQGRILEQNQIVEKLAFKLLIKEKYASQHEKRSHINQYPAICDSRKHLQIAAS